MPVSPTTQVDLLRHGEPLGGRRYRGQLDDPLSETGWRQMRAAAAGIHDWQHIISSPLLRCSEFARELGGELGIPVQFDARFKEIGFGIWEGKTVEELQAEDPDCVRRFKLDPIAHQPPGAEPLVEFRARIAAAWEEMLDRHAGCHLLLIAHAGVIRAVLSIILDIPIGITYRIAVHNAGLTRIRVDGKGEAAAATLVFHGGQP